MENLKCPVCLHYFEKATILRCGHSFCKACLEEIDSRRQDRHTIKCPTCRGNTKLRLKRVAGLTRNFVLDGLVDAFKKKDEARKAREGNNVPNIPAEVQHDYLMIVKKVELTYTIYAMTAYSENIVAIGYGPRRRGSDYISLSGSVSQYQKRTVGFVYSIALLTDGSQVVTQSKKSFRVYNPQGILTQYELGHNCKPGEEFLKMCTDKHNRIYAVNGNQEITMFNDGYILKKFPTGRSKPKQICVNREGTAIVTSTCNMYSYPNTVNVYDYQGKIVKSIVALNTRRPDYDEEHNDIAEYDVEERDTVLYAAVDRTDRVLVAKVSVDSDTFQLTRYAFQGTQLIKEMGFKRSIRLPIVITHTECHMVSLTPNLIAFATGKVLYFMRLDD